MCNFVKDIYFFLTLKIFKSYGQGTFSLKGANFRTFSREKIPVN